VTEVEICSAALNALGVKGIASLEDDSTEARACKTYYSLIRDRVLEDRVWSFAKKHYALSPDATAPIFGFTKRFLIPSEIVRVHRVDNGDGDFRMAWEIFGEYIHADDPAIYVTAVRREVDTSLYSPAFTLCVALRLATVLAVPLKENRQLKVDLWEEYKFELKEASGLDGSQGKSEATRSDFLSRRR
jgi:hypothetical protein